MINIYCDGGARGNPGPAAYGFVVKSANTVLHLGQGYIGIATNNIAEYTAVCEALSWLKKEYAASDLHVFVDSQLVASQLSGLYKVKNAQIREKIVRIRELEASFGQIRYQHIPREQNSQADKLVNQALDDKT